MHSRRDPIDRLVDLAVAMPVSTVVALRRSMPVVGRLFRRSVVPGAEIADALLTGTDDHGEPAAPAVDAAEPIAVDDSVTAPAGADRPAPTSSEADALPIDGYDHLAARQVVDLLAALDPAELHVVAAYERANRHRQTVLRKIEQLAT